MATEINKENARESFRIISLYCQCQEDCEKCGVKDWCNGMFDGNTPYDLGVEIKY